jgi:hypothetical protein
MSARSAPALSQLPGSRQLSTQLRECGSFFVLLPSSDNNNIRSNAILDLIVIIQKIFWGVSSHFSDIYKKL